MKETLIVKKDSDHKFISANERWMEKAGFSCFDDIFGKTDLDCPWADFIEIYHQHERDALRGVVYGALQPTILENNEIIWIYNHKRPCFNENKVIVGVDIVAQVVSENNFVNYTNKQFKHDSGYFGIDQYHTKKPTNEKLTSRELAIVFFISRGLTSKECAKRLEVSYRTVEKHIENIKRKLKCRSRSAIIEYAVANNLVKILPRVF